MVVFDTGIATVTVLSWSPGLALVVKTSVKQFSHVYERRSLLSLDDQSP